MAGSEDDRAMWACLRELGWKDERTEPAAGRTEAGSTLAALLAARGPVDYAAAVDMLHCLVPQLETLLARGKGMPSIEAEDVIVLGGGWYRLAGLHRAWPLQEGGDLTCTAPPVSRTCASPGTLGGECLPPELQGALSLPISCTVQASYFSLAMLLRQALGLQGSLAPLAGSKLYYCLKRCLRPEPAKRQLFFI